MNPRSRKYAGIVAVALLALVVIVYGQTFAFSFTNYDDDLYITDNPHVATGLGFDNIAWAFTTAYVSNWHPVTWVSHMLDVTLFGLEPGPHHVVNLLIHAVNSVLVFFLLRRMTGASWASAFAAALFAVHPLHVESVAWVAERKDVLSSSFWLLTWWGYLRYVERRTACRYLVVLGFFALGLMAKPMLVTLPAWLLLLDYWPLGRIERLESGVGGVGYSDTQVSNPGFWIPNGQSVAPAPKSKRSSRTPHTPCPTPQTPIPRLIVEKLPLFALVLASSLITLFVQRGARIEQAPGARIANAVVAYGQYLRTAILPIRLAVLYPHSGTSLPARQVVASALVLAALTAIALHGYRRRPYLVVGWFWFLGTLLPVIGLVQVGFQARADRYMYMPILGLILMAVWSAADLEAAWHIPKNVVWGTASAILAVYTFLAGVQASYWRDSETLYRHALECTDRNWQVHYNLGNALALHNDLDGALTEYRECLEIQPDYRKAVVNVGNALATQGHIPEAAAYFERAIALDPEQPDAYFNLGNTLLQRNLFQEAATQYGKAVELKTDYVEARVNLGISLANLGRLQQAVSQFAEALRLDPGHARARQGLAQLRPMSNSSDGLGARRP